MNWLEFIIEMKWPILILIVLISFHRMIRNIVKLLSGRLYKVRLPRGSELMFRPLDKQKVESIRKTNESNLTWKDYLDTLELLTCVSGIFTLILDLVSSSKTLQKDVSTIRNYMEEAEILESLLHTFVTGFRKVKETRPDSSNLSTYKSLADALSKSNQMPKWSYRPLADIIYENQNSKKDNS